MGSNFGGEKLESARNRERDQSRFVVHLSTALFWYHFFCSHVDWKITMVYKKYKVSSQMKSIFGSPIISDCSSKKQYLFLLCFKCCARANIIGYVNIN